MKKRWRWLGLVLALLVGYWWYVQVILVNQVPAVAGKGLHLLKSSGFLPVVLKAGGYNDFYKDGWRITRSSDGSKLHLQSKKYSEAVIVSCNGTVRSVLLLGFPAWISDDDRVVAWVTDDTSIDREGYTSRVVEFNSGKRMADDRYQRVVIDQSGHFGILVADRITPGDHSRLFRVDNPDESIGEIPFNRILALFQRNSELLVFALPDPATNPQPGSFLIATYAVSPEGVSLVRLKTFAKPSGYLVTDSWEIMDVSPWADEILLKNRFDLPFDDRYYLASSQGEVLQRIGRLKGVWPVFLQGDPFAVKP
jgi:hypothetical protein